MSKKLVEHPSTKELFRVAASRFMALRKSHSTACDLMWAGTLASHFSKVELTLIKDYLSPHDHALLASTTRSAR